MTATRCPVCGTDSLVTVMAAGAPGSRLLQQVCRECERRARGAGRDAARRLAHTLARLLISAGILLGVLTLFAEHLGISGEPGFGWRQIVGAEIGFLGIVLGLLMQRRLLGLGGLFLFVLSLGADVLRVGHSTGLGWRKQAALLAAVALVAGGAMWRRALKRKAAD